VTDRPRGAYNGLTAVLFDFDRTLLDLFTEPASVALAAEVAAYYRREVCPGPDEPHTRAALGRALVEHADRPYRLWVELYWALAGVDQELAERVSREVGSILTEHECEAAGALTAPAALPGVKATLAWLEDAGVALAVVASNSLAAVRTAMYRAGILSRFDVIVARTPELDLANLEPSPFPIERAIDQLGCTPSDAVMVGDSVADMRAGLAAKVYTVGVVSHPGQAERLREAGAAAVIADMTALKSLLGHHLVA
jgi:phosphoglycolate phosphatase-like HAD superfamily hydrolase